MSVSEPVSIHDEAPKWDIAVACDIRIGELFRDNPDLAGKYLDIDASALETILGDLNPEKAGSLLFMASHDHSINGHETSTLGETIHPKRRSKDQLTLVQVGIGGSDLSVEEDQYKKLYRQFYRDDEKVARLREPSPAPERTSLSKIIGREPKLTDGHVRSNIEQIAAIMGVTRNEKEIQKTTVHELRHASESKAEQREDSRKQALFMGRRALKPLMPATVVLLPVGIVEIVTHRDNTLLDIAALGVAGLLSWKPYVKAVSQAYEDSYWEVSSNEKNAREVAEKRSEELPQVISFKRLPGGPPPSSRAKSRQNANKAHRRKKRR